MLSANLKKYEELKNQAQKALEQNNLEVSQYLFQKALHYYPLSYTCYINLSRIFHSLKKYQQAYQSATFAIHLNPYCSFGYYNRFQISWHQKQIDHALKDLNATLSCQYLRLFKQTNQENYLVKSLDLTRNNIQALELHYLLGYRNQKYHNPDSVQINLDKNNITINGCKKSDFFQIEGIIDVGLLHLKEKILEKIQLYKKLINLEIKAQQIKDIQLAKSIVNIDEEKHQIPIQRFSTPLQKIYFPQYGEQRTPLTPIQEKLSVFEPQKKFKPPIKNLAKQNCQPNSKKFQKAYSFTNLHQTRPSNRIISSRLKHNQENRQRESLFSVHSGFTRCSKCQHDENMKNKSKLEITIGLVQFWKPIYAGEIYCTIQYDKNYSKTTICKINGKYPSWSQPILVPVQCEHEKCTQISKSQMKHFLDITIWKKMKTSKQSSRDLKIGQGSILAKVGKNRCELKFQQKGIGYMFLSLKQIK